MCTVDAAGTNVSLYSIKKLSSEKRNVTRKITRDEKFIFSNRVAIFEK